MWLPGRRVSFIVRLTQDETGRVCGVVERVRTGKRERFYGTDAIGPVIERMAGEDPGHTPEGRDVGTSES